MAVIPNSEKRRHVHLALALISIAAAYAFFLSSETFAHWFKETFHRQIPKLVTWLVELSSPMVVFGILSELFEKHLWKWPIFQKISELCPPVVEGSWKAEFRSSYDDFKTPYPADVKINQSWSSISVTLDAEKSRSQSEVAAIHQDSGDCLWLVYEYLNEPHLEATKTMHAHRGTVRLQIKPEELRGEYYTGRDRNTNGTLTLTRDKK